MISDIVYKEASISYKINGQGSCIVLLHGFLEDASIWDDFTESLKNEAKVICVDLPGFGNSSMISDSVSMHDMAMSVISVLKQNNINNCTIVGHSMGGYVALEIAKLMPDLLNGLVLFHSHAAEDDTDAKINRDKVIEVVKRNHASFISSFIPSLFAADNIPKYKKDIEKLTRISQTVRNEAIISALYAMKNRNDSRELLKNTNIPILFIIGKKDSKIPLEKYHQQVFIPKNCETLILENVGHMGFIEAKEITLTTIINFANKYKADN